MNWERTERHCPTHQVICQDRSLPWASGSFDWLTEKYLLGSSGGNLMFTSFLLTKINSCRATHHQLSFLQCNTQSSCKHTVSARVLLQHCLNQNCAMSQQAQGCSTRTHDSKWFGPLVLQNLVYCPASAEPAPFLGTRTTSSCC